MANVTADDVKEILEDTSLTDPEVESYIDMSVVLLDEVFESEDLSSNIRKELERWLTAHLISVTKERTVAQEKIGDASVKYTGKWADGLKSTSYGQVVLQMDITGKLGALGKRKANITAVEEDYYNDD